MNKLGPVVVSFVIHAGVLACATAIGISAGSVPRVIFAELTVLEVSMPGQPESRPPRPGPQTIALPKPIVTPAPRAPETKPEEPKRDEPPREAEAPPAPVPSMPRDDRSAFETLDVVAAPSPVAAATASTVDASPPVMMSAAGVRSSPASSGSSAMPSVASVPPDGVTNLAAPRGGYQVRPSYPASARVLGVQGTTLLRVFVAVDGRVTEVAVDRSAGHPDLDRAAADAVRRWRFEPARRGNAPVAMWVLLPVEFRLR